jgi:hypothetical protein
MVPGTAVSVVNSYAATRLSVPVSLLISVDLPVHTDIHEHVRHHQHIVWLIVFTRIQCEYQLLFAIAHTYQQRGNQCMQP